VTNVTTGSKDAITKPGIEPPGTAKVALIVGATGLVGGCLLQLLLQSGNYRQVIALVRRPIGYQHVLLTEKIIHFNELALALTGLEVDHVFCCLGSTIRQAGSRSAFRDIDLKIPQQLAQQMVGHANHFLLVSALGANPDSPVFYNRVKGELEGMITTLAYPCITIVRPSLLSGSRQRTRPMEALGVKMFSLLRPVFRGPLQNYAAVSAMDVASVLLKQAQEVNEDSRTKHCKIIESAAMQGAAD